MTPDPQPAPKGGSYGRVKISTIKAAYDELRDACRAEGTPRVQDAIDRYEQWADYAFTRRATHDDTEDEE